MKRWKQLTIKTKIMILYSVLSAVLLAFLIPAIYMIVVSTLKQTLLADMDSAAENICSCLYEEDGMIYIDEDQITPEMIGSGIYIEISMRTDEDGSAENIIIYSSPDMDWAKEEAEPDYGREWEYEIYEYVIDTQNAEIYVLGNVYYNSFVEDMFWILVLMAVIFFIISVLGSRIIVSRALWPVKMITRTAAEVSANDPSKRIEKIESKDEVGELAKTFNIMLDDLEEAFKRERQFTSDVSHELRTPLAVIETATDDALRSDDPAIVRENLETIKKENDRMAKMISQLLFLSRGYEGRLRYEPELFSLRDMAESVADVSYYKAGNKNITIHNEIPGQLTIYADQSLFIQLFINLVDNAVKYGKENGNVWIRAAKQDNCTKIFVKDDGIGIAEEDLEHIFERFYRADRARDRSGQGLGLSIAKQIVDLHGGTISAESTLNEGTMFIVEIPAA